MKKMIAKDKALRIKALHELIAVILIVGLLIYSSIYNIAPIRVILGFPFLLFLPGYTLLAVLFPRKSGINIVERVILSFGMSLVLVPLSAFLINYTPWGLRLAPVLISMSLLVTILASLSYYRRIQAAKADRFEIVINFGLSSWSRAPGLDRVISLALLGSILVAFIAIGYAIAKPKPGESFTEFYILNLDRKAAGYPQTIPLDGKTNVLVGIVNREHRDMTYKLEVVINGGITYTLESVSLADTQKWEQEIPLVPRQRGDQQKVEINLYKPGQSKPLLLILWIKVT